MKTLTADERRAIKVLEGEIKQDMNACLIATNLAKEHAERAAKKQKRINEILHKPKLTLVKDDD